MFILSIMDDKIRIKSQGNQNVKNKNEINNLSKKLNLGFRIRQDAHKWYVIHKKRTHRLFNFDEIILER